MVWVTELQGVAGLTGEPQDHSPFYAVGLSTNQTLYLLCGVLHRPGARSLGKQVPSHHSTLPQPNKLRVKFLFPELCLRMAFLL